ncbi:MAG TPA: two-component sensor histidine kinase, partial [Mobilitalea sp.]|nr:two-component sensor histidine kinase [Mobilitalea sp.]
MKITIGILVIIVILLIAYIALLRLELRSINRQISKRMDKDSRQSIRVDFINKELNQLTENINRSLKAEEILRLNGV